jgi:short-subunit dehydrogenase
MSGLPLRGTVAVVTGASSGIGAATAETFARRGARVAAVARREDRLTELAERCGDVDGSVLAVPLDVCAPDAAQRLADAVQPLGPVDVLVNNAGAGLHKRFVDSTPAELEGVVEINLMAPMRLTAALLPGMLSRRRGVIVNITSISGHFPAPDEPVYGATKAALARWTEGLVLELAGTGVRAAEVSPGPIDTEIWDHVGRFWTGRFYPPSQVAVAVADAVERGRTTTSVPRKFGLAPALFPLLREPMRQGALRFGRSRP